MILKKIFPISLILGLIVACIDPFDQDIQDSVFDSRIVVDASLKAENEFHKILITQSAPVQSNTGFLRVSGATVEIKDENGNCIHFPETGPGNYAVDSTVFKPEVNQSYQLRIQLENGRVLISDFQKLLQTKPIDYVNVKKGEETILSGNSFLTSEVVDIYVNADSENENKFFLYEYEGTFGFEVPYQGSLACDSGQTIRLSQEDTVICYRSESVELPYNIYSTEVFNSTTEQKVITVIPTRTFAIGYSMLVKKYALTESYYNYLNQLKDQNDYGGSIFDPPPTQVIGNIKYEDNESEKVLGFFSLISRESKRTFIYNDILGEPLRDPKNEEACPNNLDEIIDEDTPEQFLIRPPKPCCDCRLVEGATVEKPEFWPVL